MVGGDRSVQFVSHGVHRLLPGGARSQAPDPVAGNGEQPGSDLRRVAQLVESLPGNEERVGGGGLGDLPLGVGLDEPDAGQRGRADQQQDEHDRGDKRPAVALGELGQQVARRRRAR